MKIVALNLPDKFPEGKITVKDLRIDKLKDIFKSAKKVYAEAQVIEEAKLAEADVVVAKEGDKLQMVISDLDFIEKRLERAPEEAEKNLLLKMKQVLEKEDIFKAESLSEEERKIVSTYALFCSRPVLLVGENDLADAEALVLKIVEAAGYVSFMTAGEKDSHAWMVRKNTPAKQAAGAIHTDIERGFIRAEIIPCADIIAAGDFNSVRGNVRLEQKEYLVQDGDWVVFRFNK